MTRLLAFLHLEKLFCYLVCSVGRLLFHGTQGNIVAISYTHGSFGELVKAVETLVSRFVFAQHFLFS